MVNESESEQAKSGKTPWWLAVRVIDEPGAVFRELAARPRSLAPLLLLVIVTAVATFIMPAEPLQQAVRTQMEAAQQRAPDRFTDADIEDRVARAGGLQSRAIIFASQAIFALIALAIAAGVLTLIFGAMASEPLKFKDEFAIVTHAYVPQLLGALLIVGLMRFAGMEQLRLSLGFLFDAESAPFLRSLGNQFTFFGAWNVALLALGNQIRTNAKGIGGPLAVVGGLWVLVNVGFAALGSVLSGFAG